MINSFLEKFLLFSSGQLNKKQTIKTKMFGKNKILGLENHDGTHLAVQEIFPTIQGEGPFVGQPAVFIRLGGCNLACSFCDTEFDSFEQRTLDEIISEVIKLSQNSAKKIVKKLVVITGGEPMRQDIVPLCEKLIEIGFFVQIETNGTIFRQLPKEVQIVCSPKVSNGKYYQIRPDLLPRIQAIKFLISASNPDYFDIGDVGQEGCEAKIYLQPIDEQDEILNQRNQLRALEICLEKGYYLSLQTHKILKIR